MAKSKRQIQVEGIRFNQMIDIIAARYEKPFRNEIKRSMFESADYYAKTGFLSQDILDRHKKNIQKIAMRLYSQSIDSSSTRQFETIQKKHNHIKMEKKDALDEFERLSVSYILEHGLELSTTVSNTTRKEVQRVLAGSITQGLAVSETVKILKDRALISSRNRARLISVTETHTSASWANINSTMSIADEVGLELEKVWNTTEDERTRMSHRFADGQKLGIKEPFTVQGESLEYPGDQNGSAGNVINCRCFMTYE